MKRIVNMVFCYARQTHEGWNIHFIRLTAPQIGTGRNTIKLLGRGADCGQIPGVKDDELLVYGINKSAQDKVIEVTHGRVTRGTAITRGAGVWSYSKNWEELTELVKQDLILRGVPHRNLYGKSSKILYTDIPHSDLI